MNITKRSKESFAVIGKQGSTNEGRGFIQKLWADANGNFTEISHLAKRDSDGSLVGIWGAMSDFELSFHPWENNFSQGLYLAGIECEFEAEAPSNWVKCVIPGYEYICAEVETDNTFSEVIRYLKENDLQLVGAVNDFTCPKTWKNYMYFPVRKL